MDAPKQASTRRARLVLFATALACAALGVAYYWPTVRIGLFSDDYIHLGIVGGEESLVGFGSWELYTFSTTTLDRMGPVQGDIGVWWGQGVVVRFLRPLAALAYHVYWRLFGDDGAALLWVAVGWYAVLVALCVAWFGVMARESGRGPWTVLLAGVFFATMKEHEGNVGWLASHYSILAVVPCLASLLCYDRYRTAGGRKRLASSLVLLAVGLFTGEIATSMLGLFLAYELVLARGPLRERARALLPVGLVVLAWTAVYVAGGWGVQNSVGYIDPLQEPESFWAAWSQRYVEHVLRTLMPGMLEPEFAPWFFPRAIAFYDHPGRFYSHVVAVLLVCFGAQAFLDRAVRFALLGAAIALVPMAAAPPNARVALVPTIAMSWVYASFVTGALAILRRPRRLLRPWNVPRLAVALVLVASSAADFALVRHRLAGRAALARGWRERALALPLPEGPSEAGSERDLRVLMLTVPTAMEMLLIPFVRLGHGHPWPGGIWSLSPVPSDHVLERTGERSFRLAITDPDWSGGMVRPEDAFPDSVLDPGSEFRLGVLQVTIDEVVDGEVRSVDVSIDRALDDPSVFLFAWRAGGWTRLRPPPVGGAVAIDFQAPQ